MALHLFLPTNYNPDTVKVMVFTVQDINNLIYPTQKSFTPNEAYRDYSFTINPAELRNEQVERLYGPFETRSYPTYYSSPRPTPVANGNLRPLPRDEKKSTEFEKVSLEELKKMIAIREAEQLRRTNKLNEDFANARRAPLVQAKPLRAPPIIVIEDSEDSMDLGSDADSFNENDSNVNMSSENEKDADDEEMNTEPESIVNMVSSDNELNEVTAEDNSSSEDSYATAADQEQEEQDVLELKALEEQETLLLSQLRESQSVVKSIQVELLGMKVRMSLNKNKNENKKKVSSPAAVPSPKLGTKRNAPIVIDESTPPPPPKRRTRRNNNNRRPDIPSYGYSAPIPQPPPFYQQLPVQNPYNTYVPAPVIPPPAFFPPRQQSPPPPPPPPTTRPVTPPPPPPPSAPSVPVNKTSNYRQNDKLPRPRPHITEQKSDVESMKDSIQVEQTLKDVEQLISQRIFSDMISYPKVDVKRSPRPVRLVTVDKYTMPMHMLLLNEGEKEAKWEPPSTKFVLPAGVPVQTEMNDAWYESPFFVMLRRKATAQPFNSVITPIVQQIIDSVSPTDNLDSIKIGELYFVNLENALHVARIHSYQHPENEFLAALRLELSFYVYGNTKMFQDDYNEIVAHIPLSVDVEWQRIRAEATFSSQLPLILDLLHHISLRHTSFVSKESVTLSSMTVEVLIRLLRLNGSQQVLQLLTNVKESIESDNAVVVDMDDAPGLYLQESDKYGIWMLILFQHISKGLPEGVCSTWMNSLVKDGAPSKVLSLFMIDWNTSDLLEHPLDQPTLHGAINILLSMLRHFGKKACNDIRRKPLLVGVLRTFSGFLTCIPRYKIASTLVLVRNMAGLIEQIPEIQEIMIELEIKVGNPGTNIVDHIYSSKRIMSASNIYSLTYHVARYYFEKHPFSRQLLLIVSNILLYPLLEHNTQKIQLQIMDQLTGQTLSTVTDEKLILLVDTIRQRYLTAMGLDSLMATNSPQKSSNQRKLCKHSFAWINLLLLTVISKFLYPPTSIVRDSLEKSLKSIFEEGMKKVDSDDGKLVLFKYGQQLQLI